MDQGGGSRLLPEEWPSLIGPLEQPARQVHYGSVAEPSKPFRYPGSPVAGRGIHHDGARLRCAPQAPNTRLVGIDWDRMLEVADGELGQGAGVQNQWLRLPRIALPTRQILSADPFQIGKPR